MELQAAIVDKEFLNEKALLMRGVGEILEEVSPGCVSDPDVFVERMSKETEDKNAFALLLRIGEMIETSLLFLDEETTTIH